MNFLAHNLICHLHSKMHHRNTPRKDLQIKLMRNAKIPVDEKQEITRWNIFSTGNYRRIFFAGLNCSDEPCRCFRKKVKHQTYLSKREDYFSRILHLSAIAFSKNISHGSNKRAYLYFHIKLRQYNFRSACNPAGLWLC